jgi:uncharacterized membrane protein YgaE (UPF0421/DUF939 family)
MQISSLNYQFTQINNNSYTYTSTSQNSDDSLKKALMQVPADKITKVLEKAKIPINENEIKNILDSIDKGFEIYA